MLAMSSPIVMMPEIVTTTVMSLPSGVTWIESRAYIGIGRDKGVSLGEGWG